VVRGNVEVTSVAIGKTLDALTARHGDALIAKAQQVFEETKAQTFSVFLEKLKNDGWITAGAFYMKITQAQDQISRAITSIPSSTRPIRDLDRPALVEMSVQRGEAIIEQHDGRSGVQALGSKSSKETEVLKIFLQHL
jgi:conjugal transfer/type IV secretion protein DotA/TraY